MTYKMTNKMLSFQLGWSDLKVLRHPRDLHQDRPLPEHRCRNLFPLRAWRSLRP